MPMALRARDDGRHPFPGPREREALASRPCDCPVLVPAGPLVSQPQDTAVITVTRSFCKRLLDVQRLPP